MVTVVTSVSITPPTGDNVVETHSKVSVPPLGLASGGFMHQTFCPVLIVSVIPTSWGAVCHRCLALSGSCFAYLKISGF